MCPVETWVSFPLSFRCKTQPREAHYVNLSEIPKYAPAAEAARLISLLGEEFALVQNPSYIFPPFEAYPLAPGHKHLATGLRAAVMDMDGTTTTTEPLCIHSLETMVRRVTGRTRDADWAGLDKEADYPHIIGNSTTKHVEYLLRTYADGIQRDAVVRAYLQAAAWSLVHAVDEGRRIEVRHTLQALGAGALLDDPRLARLGAMSYTGEPEESQVLDVLHAGLEGQLRLDSLTNLTRAAIDIYYQRYHEILAAIDRGEGALAMGGVGEGPPICPMPGVGIYLALIKGWLGADAPHCLALLQAPLSAKGGEAGGDAAQRLRSLGAHFAQHPAKVAIVTSSIAYEAGIVLREVFRLLREEAAQWPISEAVRQHVLEGFASPEVCYDAIITASDVDETRLKPHRDLYSIALHRLGLPPEAFGDVVGFEDSESGTIAIRAAGISVCCAVPFAMTTGHAFHAATQVCPGGLPEVILNHGAFLPEGAS